MKVKILKEEGYDEALLGLSLSYNAPLKKMAKRAERLSSLDGGHNKFLESIVVWLDITAPRYWWQQFDTYRIGITKQSESTMHTWKKKPFEEGFFTKGVDKTIIEKLETARLREDFQYVKENLPEGFLQRRVITTSYKSLRHIALQREKHRLSEWKIFLRALEGLSIPKLLFTKKKEENFLSGFKENLLVPDPISPSGPSKKDILSLTPQTMPIPLQYCRPLRIYLAAPYSHPRAFVREARVRLSDRVAARIAERGPVVFSPLTHSHRLARWADNHQDLDFWLRQDKEFLLWADELWILAIPGWEDSKGIAEEREFFKGPERFVRPEDILN